MDFFLLLKKGIEQISSLCTIQMSNIVVAVIIAEIRFPLSLACLK